MELNIKPLKKKLINLKNIPKLNKTKINNSKKLLKIDNKKLLENINFKEILNKKLFNKKNIKLKNKINEIRNQNPNKKMFFIKNLKKLKKSDKNDNINSNNDKKSIKSKKFIVKNPWNIQINNDLTKITDSNFHSNFDSVLSNKNYPFDNNAQSFKILTNNPSTKDILSNLNDNAIKNNNIFIFNNNNVFNWIDYSKKEDNILLLPNIRPGSKQTIKSDINKHLEKSKKLNNFKIVNKFNIKKINKPKSSNINTRNKKPKKSKSKENLKNKTSLLDINNIKKKDQDPIKENKFLNLNIETNNNSEFFNFTFGIKN